MCVYIYIFTHTNTNTDTDTLTYTYTCTHIYIQMHMHIHIPIHVHKHAGRCRPSQLLLGIGPNVAASIVTEAEEQCEQAQGDRCQQGDRICWYVYVYGKQLPPPAVCGG